MCCVWVAEENMDHGVFLCLLRAIPLLDFSFIHILVPAICLNKANRIPNV